MILIQLNKQDFEYDLHSLVKSFYPGEDVTVCYEEPENAGEALLKISVIYKEQEIAVRFEKDGQVVKEDTEAVEYEKNRKETKNHLKYRVYRMLSDYTGTTLPWGTLTGIRPTKIPMALLEQGMSNRDIADYMRKTYLISPAKTSLGISIANRERHILRDIDYDNGYSLYVGIPFCPSICLYCSFSSSPLSVWKKKVDEQERLRWQLEKVKDSLREKQLDYENLRESVAELRSTDSRLDSIDEELKAVSQALLAIGEITREIYDESALKLNAFASGIMDEIVGKDFGELYLDQDMEICVRTGEQTLRLSDESYGTLSQVYFAARMAIGKTLSDRESMPIVLDDTFSMYDPERLLAVFRWLKKSGSQVILFTSRLLEAETAEKVEKE